MNIFQHFRSRPMMSVEHHRTMGPSRCCRQEMFGIFPVFKKKIILMTFSHSHCSLETSNSRKMRTLIIQIYCVFTHEKCNTPSHKSYIETFEFITVRSLSSTKQLRYSKEVKVNKILIGFVAKRSSICHLNRHKIMNLMIDFDHSMRVISQKKRNELEMSIRNVKSLKWCKTIIKTRKKVKNVKNVRMWQILMKSIKYLPKSKQKETKRIAFWKIVFGSLNFLKLFSTF